MRRPAATEETACNLCGGRDYDVVGRADRDGRPLQTVLCRACGLVWVNPRPPAAAMDRYYEASYRADYTGADAPTRRKILRGLIGARERWEALAPLAGPGARVLDVGCGAGELVYLLRRAGLDASGLEPGQAYAAFARDVLGISVQNATVDAAVVAPASCDLVTMFHCLEHVPDPRAVLRAVRTWVKPGGRVVVEVPNVESIAQAPAHRFHYAHLFHFSGATLGAIGEASGLRLERTSYSPDGGNVLCVFRRGDDGERLPAGLAASAGRTRAILAGHTALGHYLSPRPYRRAIGRLGRRIAEDRLLRRLGSAEAILAWACRAR